MPRQSLSQVLGGGRRRRAKRGGSFLSNIGEALGWFGKTHSDNLSDYAKGIGGIAVNPMNPDAWKKIGQSMWRIGTNINGKGRRRRRRRN